MTARRAELVRILLVVFLTYARLARAATDCRAQLCTYLPLVERAPEAAAPTATETPTVVPPRGSCATGAPDPAEGVQAWVTNPAPAQNSIETLCVRLIVTASQSAVRRRPGSLTTSQRTPAWGQR
jgi:hypothetical protein